MGKYFGTDGFRGEANVNLTVEHAFKVGRFLGWYFGQEHKAQIVIGKDTRRSSYMFEYSLVAGLTASGADVYLLHVTTTPSVSYVVRTENFDCGIMKKVIEILEKRGDLQINTLVVEADIPVQKMNTILFELEMKGVVRVLVGGMYQLL